MQSMRVLSLNHDTATSDRVGKLASYGQNSRRSIKNHMVVKSLFIVFSWIRNYI